MEAETTQNAPHAEVRGAAEPRSTQARLAWLAYGLAVLTVVLDQLSKWWILSVVDLPAKGQVPVLPFFNLTMVWNRGVSFGLLRAHTDFGRWLLVGFSIAVVLVLGVWAWRIHRRITAAAIGLIMGGALGNNIIDRVRLGAVTDFLDFSALHFPWVFNVADAAINVGVALLLIEMAFLQPKKA